jgi:hypothetical protein
MTYATQSLSELKVLAAQLNVTPTGDKRSKQSWIDAIEAAQTVACTTEISDAQMEVIAHAADIANNVEDFWVDDSEPVNAIEHDIPAPTKKGAAAVISALLCLLIFVLTNAILATCAIGRQTVLIASMFGRYNPDFDIWYQIIIRPQEQRKIMSYAPAT